MSYTINYSYKRIDEVHKNFGFLLDNSSIHKKVLAINLKLTMDLDQLEKQASTFAFNFKTHGYINFYKTLNIRESEVYEKLKNLYIYSYAKSLHNGIFFENISNESNLGLAFRGHSSLFHILKSPYNSGFKGDFMFSSQIDLGNNFYRQALLFNLITRFSFLNLYSSSSTDALGTTPFNIFEYETYFNQLRDNYYTKDHIQQGYDSKVENSKGRGTDLKYKNGKLVITEMHDGKGRTILEFENSPIMNAFLSYDQKKIYFIPVGNGKEIEFNPSFHFCKANFISIIDDNNDYDWINRCYKSLTLSDKQEHLVCSEVFTNTGIKCRFIKIDQASKLLNVPTSDEVENFISKATDLKGAIKIQELIKEFLNEDSDDLMEFWNELLNVEEK